MMLGVNEIEKILGSEAKSLLQHQPKVPKELLHLPGPDWVNRIFGVTDRSTRVLCSLQALLGHGRLAGTGYLSILPVDQGVEHSAGASFAPNPVYFDPENILKLAIEGNCNAVASTLGGLGSIARKYAHTIPFIVKINHNESLTYPSKNMIRCFSPPSNRRGTWERWLSVQPFTSAQRKAPGRLPRSVNVFRLHMNWV
jgi:fructose-bisphosphate aldolase, class I